MKRAAAAFRDADIPFLLAGGMASWAHGGPGRDHDVDFVVLPDDADLALKVLAEAGLRTEIPPEEWLYKAYDGEAMIDIIFKPGGMDVNDAMFARGKEMSVEAMTMRVMAPEDILISKLVSMTDHYMPYDGVLEIARALREQINWDELKARCETSPFARAFITLAEGLEVAP